MTRHLTSPILRALLDRQPGTGAQAGAHLLTCARCQGKLLALAPRRARGFLDSMKDLEPTARLIQQRGPGLIEETEREFRAACQLARRLPGLPSGERRRLVFEESEIPPISLAAGLLSVLPNLIHDSPEDVVDLCEIGLDLISPEGFDVASCSTASVLAELEANLGNALRVLAQLPAAEGHLDKALILAEETPDDHVRGKVFVFASLVAMDLRRFDEALSFAQQAKRIFKRIGDDLQVNRVELAIGLVAFFQADFSQATMKLRVLAENEGLDRATRFSATFFLVKALVLSGLHFPAAALLPQLNEFGRSFPSEHLSIQFSWLKGLIVGSTGDPDSGETLMGRARAYYLDREILYDAALVGLDMAMVRFEAGHYEEAARHAAEIVDAFAVSGIHREALAAMRYFQEAIRAKDEVRARYRELQVFLPLARRDPSYTYRPGAIG